MNVSVIIASIGRPKELSFTLEILAAQTKKPDLICLSVRSETDLPAITAGADIIYGAPGASAQRNRGIERALPSSDILVFLDDDYVPNSSFIADITSFFSDNPDIVGATGLVIADGVKTGGITEENALKLIKDFEEKSRSRHRNVTDTHELYGCNMAVRADALGSIRFDEHLPLYSWQEDVDLTGLLRRRGRVVMTDAFVGVHRGVAGARTSGIRFGYSQIVNPLYLWRKGTIRPAHAARLMVKNFLANHVGLFTSETHIDRRGRAVGNWIAIKDAVRGRDDPTKILDL